MDILDTLWIVGLVGLVAGIAAELLQQGHAYPPVDWHTYRTQESAMGFTDFFRWFGGLFKKAFTAAKDAGLNDRVIELALAYVRGVQNQLLTSAEKREKVVAQLMKVGFPEALARLATELAVQLLHKEQNEPTPPPV